MPALQRKRTDDQIRYSIAQLVGLRRRMLRYALSLPPGPERNERRQIASSLHSLFRNKRWLDAHVVGDCHMLDPHNQGPLCTACGSPMKLTAIEPDALVGQDLRTFTCPRCNTVQRRIIESAVTEAWLAPRSKTASNVRERWTNHSLESRPTDASPAA